VLPGQRPLPEAAYAAVGKRPMSSPSSARICSALRRMTPVMVFSRSNGLERASVLLDPGSEERDLPVEKLDVTEQTLKQEDAMRGDPAERRFPRVLLDERSPMAGERPPPFRLMALHHGVMLIRPRLRICPPRN
jgi:hypothetical protein